MGANAVRIERRWNTDGCGIAAVSAPVRSTRPGRRGESEAGNREGYRFRHANFPPCEWDLYRCWREIKVSGILGWGPGTT